MDGNFRKPLVTEVVSDCSPGTSTEAVDDILSKQPAEHLQNDVLHTQDLTADKTTGLDCLSMILQLFDGFRSTFKQKVQKLITKKLLMAG